MFFISAPTLFQINLTYHVLHIIIIEFISSREEGKERVQFQASHRQDTPPKEWDLHHEEHNRNVQPHPFQKYGKKTLLIAVWLLMILFLTSTPEKKIEKRQLSVPIDEARIFEFPTLPSGTRINATLEGAFLPEVLEQNQRRLDLLNRQRQGGKLQVEKKKEKENYLRVYLRSDSIKELTNPKLYAISPPDQIDLANSTRLSIMFDIGEDNLEIIEESNEKIQLVIESNFTKTSFEKKQEMPLILSYDVNPINMQIGVIFAAFVLIFLYALIIWEVCCHFERRKRMEVKISQ